MDIKINIIKTINPKLYKILCNLTNSKNYNIETTIIQTPEICLEAIKQDSNALKYIKYIKQKNYV